MRGRSPFSALRWLSLVFVLAGVIIFTLQLVRFSRLWANFPPGLTIAGIPVGQINRQQAAERLLATYSLPVELHYGNAVIQLAPSVVGFQLDMDNMLAAADLERTRQTFWEAFWNFLWGRTGARTDIPLRDTYSEERLRHYLNEEIAARYDQAPTPAMPVVGTVNFELGKPGTALDVERAIPLIEAALRSPTQRIVTLPLQRTSPGRPPFRNLEILLKQTIDGSQFDGLLGLYLFDVQTGQELHLLYRQGRDLPTQPDAAFSAASAIKVPIMVSIFRRIDLSDLDEEEDSESASVALKLMEEMITRSGDAPADQLMESILDKARGPLQVTEDMQALGLENTFSAGYFYNTAPLLGNIKTSANQRTDVQTDPDPLSQTTPTEIGMLLGDIYQCARSGGGALVAIFPGEITQAECENMIKFLLDNHASVLIEAGVADGTPVAHKHGWIQDSYGVIRDVSDAAIVFTPGGTYVLTVFLNHADQIDWATATDLVRDLSRAVYNFYNLPSP